VRYKGIAWGVAALLAAVVAVRGLRSRGGVTAPSGAGAAPSARTIVPLELEEVAYDGKVGDGWQDWGWGRHELSDNGPAKIVFTGYGGLILHHASFVTRFGGVTLRYRAPAEFGDFLFVTLNGLASTETQFPKVRIEPRHVAILDDGWREALIPWAELNPTNAPFERIMIGAYRQVGSDWVLLDKIALTKVTRAQSSRPTELARGALEIRCGEPAKPISPMIYGVSMASWATGSRHNRIGGNPITRLNWDLGNVWNQGSDWFFENVRGTEGSVYKWVDDAAQAGVRTALVVPTIGWVAKDTTAVGFPRAKFAAQQKFDPYRPEAGNGLKPDGSKIQPGPPTETSVEATPELIGRWVQTMHERDTKRATRGISMYILDNEPSLWNETHRDVHPEPETYDELLDRTLRYAAAIRNADPEAWIAGPAEWGWTGYLYSAKDRETGVVVRPDRRVHGDLPLIPWYLRRLADHEHTTGQRLLDVLDVHFYPAAPNVWGASGRTDPDGAALRIRSTRALWDPTYSDESWINEPVRLIPRMREWVQENYPGRKISLGEWSFGAEDHISGGIAAAEALGRFGEQGLDAAYYWGGPKQDSSVYFAFRAFLNFDGKGGRFLDLSVRTHMAEPVSLFASRSDDGKHVVAVLINRDGDQTVRAAIDAHTCGTLLTQRAFSYASGMHELQEESPAAVSSSLEQELPPWSLRVLDLTFRSDRPPPG
jgi:hypothetical protein